jgi:hypothetical protein
MVVSLIALIVSLLLKEVPLRKTLDMPAAVAASEAGSAPAFVDPPPVTLAQTALSTVDDPPGNPGPPAVPP